MKEPTMKLTTTYMGIRLKNPLVASASPLSHDIAKVRQLEDAGASAVVMYSLFEEQIVHDNKALDHFLTQGTDSFAEALDYFPEPDEYHNRDAEDYLNQIIRLKKAVDIPIIASLNGISAGGWTSYAKRMEEAGADGLELNIYYIPTDPYQTSADVENLYLTVLQTVKASVRIPVSMKMGPYFSSFANMARRLDEAGADALVLFNRFYQPDIDLENLEVVPNLQFSSSTELRLPLRWLAILYGHLNCSLGATTGVHSAQDVIKLLMAGADVTMMTSALMKNGIGKISEILHELEHWMNEHEYESVDMMKGSMSYRNVRDPQAFTRANYMKTLQSIK